MNSKADAVYSEAVEKGNYDLYVGNLFGKHDNLRIYWEDQLTRMVIRPYLADLITHKRKQNKKVRIIDLGSGSGQGYEIISKINKHDLDLGLYHSRVLNEDEIEVYLGVDLSQAMVDKGNEIYANKSRVRFLQTDLRNGLKEIRDEEPAFDIYFSSYGSLSHLNTNDLKSLLVDICEHGRDGSLVALDLIGRYSIEWPRYWQAETESEKYRDYSMSYLYPQSGHNQDIDHFPIRFWVGAEIEALAKQLQKETGVKIEVVRKFDRSIMVGRHVDTREYNPQLKPIRRIANRLHEDYMRTDLEQLLIDRKTFPQHPNPEVNTFFDELTKSWNTLVKFCERRLKNNVSLIDLKDWSSFPTPLQFALMTVDRVVSSAAWMWHGDPRANIIEPQLGYALRSLENNMQKGLGCGHGLLVILKIKK